MARRKAPKEENPELDMSSLIDVSFLLLIYFLVTSTLDPKEADLGMTMPTNTSSSPSEVEIDQMTVEVNSSGHIVLNEEVLDTDIDNHEVPLLLDRLRTYAESARLTDSQPMVIIAADDASKGQRFVDVLNALSDKQVDIRNVTITGFKDE
ncbi:MAG: biopolymer transporter ExbD [Verrucomicrobiales bacterium]|jgi:biopolymer transport protein ExbD|nr:biopolymer transporter ExbD [Verrucomicrobiales bacterium]MDB3940958.1 biopolymer transporter ExbD [Verrucomicrobiales bacterium]